jgi:transketolase
VSENKAGPDLFDCRDAFAATLEAYAGRDPRVVVVVNDSIGSSKVSGFQKKYPERLINVGIAEQNMVGVAAGLANGGLLPFVCGAACFLTARALEQIKVDAAYSQANIKLVGMASGMAYGEMGPTHHSIEDLAWTRAIAGLTVIVPADPLETSQAVLAAAEITGPVFLRLSRWPVPAVHPQDYQFRVGKAARLRDGKALTIIANGTMVTVALQAAVQLAQEGIQARVLNVSTLKPLDTGAVLAAARETGRIITIEEATIHGGLGSAVAETVVQACPVPMRILGVPDVFAPTGPVDYLFKHFGLTCEGVVQAAKELMGDL